MTNTVVDIANRWETASFASWYSDMTNTVVDIANRWETVSFANWYSDMTNTVVDIANRWETACPACLPQRCWLGMNKTALEPTSGAPLTSAASLMLVGPAFWVAFGFGCFCVQFFLLLLPFVSR